MAGGKLMFDDEPPIIIRPLKILHNALTLKQLDDFLEFVTTSTFTEQEFE